MLAVIGGGAGLLLGYVLATAVHQIFQSGRDASSAFDIHPDLRVIGFTGGLSILTALAFGVVPAFTAADAHVSDVLKAQTRSVFGGRLRLPRLLVSMQIALSLTALVAAALLGRSLSNLQSIDIGFDRENLTYVSVNPAQAGYSPERLGSYVERLREQLASLPGTVGVSPTEVRLLSGNGNALRVHIPGRPVRIQRGVIAPSQAANLNAVGDGFFAILRIPLLAGRPIERRDMHPESAAAMVDELFVRRFFPNENPLGRRFGVSEKEPTRYEIVGVARDSRYRALQGDAVPTIYPALVPSQLGGAVHFAIRATIDSAAMAPAVRRAVAAVDPAVPVTELHTQTALIDRLLRTERMLAFLSGLFGAVALTLAGIGIGGLLAYAVARRTNEIGIRVAVGARAGDVIEMILRDSLWLVGTGVVLGLPCVYVIGQVLKSALFQLEPLDPMTASLSCLVLFTVALLAAWIPARRAAGIDPITALRQD